MGSNIFVLISIILRFDDIKKINNRSVIVSSIAFHKDCNAIFALTTFNFISKILTLSMILILCL